MTAVTTPADPVTAYYIATVWMTTDDPDTGRTIQRQVVRLPAVSEAAYRAALVALWPGKALSFGPVGLSKVQA